MSDLQALLGGCRVPDVRPRGYVRNLMPPADQAPKRQAEDVLRRLMRSGKILSKAELIQEAQDVRESTITRTLLRMWKRGEIRRFEFGRAVFWASKK